ncbi:MULTISPECIES: class I SAM-dependent methyltransferase [Nocardia]|uniref:class I SAM-dependent methyltransferase n=1 Tax=Nocardia TaxID=1817 RepID=UPI0003143846|nr:MULTISPECIES: class I SAM-dependent methyltransferase [Nocardia]
MSNPGPTLASEYADTSPLQVRIDTHARHSEHPDDPITHVLDALELTGGEDLADIGCGDGRFLAHLARSGHRGRLVGVDNSPAMVTATAVVPGVEAVLAEAAALLFADDEFDRTTARHMLYHVPDPAAALREFARVTRPGGRVSVTVNHHATAACTRELITDCARPYGLRPAEHMTNGVDSTTLPDLMKTTIGEPQIQVFDNALVFDNAPPLIRFAEALFSFCGIDTASPHRAEILDAVTTEIRDWFASHPGRVWRDPKGYIVATAIIE